MLEKIAFFKERHLATINSLMQKRDQARRDGDYERADAIRLALEKEHFVIADRHTGTQIRYDRSRLLPPAWKPKQIDWEALESILQGG